MFIDSNVIRHCECYQDDEHDHSIQTEEHLLYYHFIIHVMKNMYILKDFYIDSNL